MPGRRRCGLSGLVVATWLGGSHDLPDRLPKPDHRPPTRKVVFDAPEIRVIANVIAFTGALLVSPVRGDSGMFGNEFEGLEDRATVRLTTPDIVDRSALWLCDEPRNDLGNVLRMHVVAYLFAFIPKNRIFPSLDVALYEITEKIGEAQAPSEMAR